MLLWERLSSCLSGTTHGMIYCLISSLLWEKKKKKRPGEIELCCLFLSQLYQFGFSSSTFQNSSDLDTRNESEALPCIFPKLSFQRKPQNLLSGPQGSYVTHHSFLWAEYSQQSTTCNFTFPVHSLVRKGAILNLHNSLGKGSNWLSAGKG